MKYAIINNETDIVKDIIDSPFEPEFDPITTKTITVISLDKYVGIKTGYKWIASNRTFEEAIKRSAKEIKRETIINKNNVILGQITEVSDKHQRDRDALIPKDETLLELWKQQSIELNLFDALEDDQKKLSDDEIGKLINIPVVSMLSVQLGVKVPNYFALISGKIFAFKQQLALSLANQKKEEKGLETQLKDVPDV